MPLQTPDSNALASWLKQIAGAVPTDRSSTRDNLRELADRDHHHMFGVDVEERWDEDCIKLMVRRVGVLPDPAPESGQDYIDVNLTLDRLDECADMIGTAFEDGESFPFASGHPSAIA